jgi:hypothetical protein
MFSPLVLPLLGEPEPLALLTILLGLLGSHRPPLCGFL